MNYRVVFDEEVMDIRKTEAAVDRETVFPSLAIARAELKLQASTTIATMEKALKDALKVKENDLPVETVEQKKAFD